MKTRKATADDAQNIAELITISSDGIAAIEWQLEAEKREGDITPLDIGVETYSDPYGDYSFSNCDIAEIDGKVAGMLLSFAMPEDCISRANKTRPQADDPDLFAPYMYLEEPDSWYICGVATYTEYRGQGIGSRLMALSEQHATENGKEKISLVVFEQNTIAYEFYKKLGFQVVDHAPIVQHPCIPYTGNALLMVKPLNTP